MRKFLIAKGNLHKSDHMRALVTDTLPGDVPIVISNDGFYQNMKPTSLTNNPQRELVDKILREPGNYTIPYRYSILRSGNTPRRLSLMHPAGQLDVVALYQEFGELICYYCRKSDASIRSPRKIGSSFFVRGSISEKNKFKGSGVDTVQIESSVSNPASYFSYAGFDRAFKFFASADYMRLEKRYSIMHFADITKCFNSIYTHTLFWAVADTKTAKENVRSQTFSNRFDRLMQSVNYNETNGICIGAEVSRIFAEIILSDVDRSVILLLESKGLRYRVDYEFRRYVDDFYVFSKNSSTSTRVLAAIESCLSKFNLHLNDDKTRAMSRPFITPKSRMIRDTNRTLEEFFDKFIRTSQIGTITFSYPVKIRRERALLRMLLESVKSSCYDHESGYEATSNYIISSLVH